MTCRGKDRRTSGRKSFHESEMLRAVLLWRLCQIKGLAFRERLNDSNFGRVTNPLMYCWVKAPIVIALDNGNRKPSRQISVLPRHRDFAVNHADELVVIEMYADLVCLTTVCRNLPACG